MRNIFYKKDFIRLLYFIALKYIFYYIKYLSFIFVQILHFVLTIIFHYKEKNNHMYFELDK